MYITTNRNFEDWGELFGDKVMASAKIDRIIHHAFIIKITGESYRVRDIFSHKGSGDITALLVAKT